ncbi:kinase-like domain-containing protein [Suillus variegatus]|nr:kinase-like domain-containing protein [Suillus variegatus]
MRFAFALAIVATLISATAAASEGCPFWCLSSSHCHCPDDPFCVCKLPETRGLVQLEINWFDNSVSKVSDGFGCLPALLSPWLKLLKDIAQGFSVIEAVHSRSITHGDSSGNNVLVDKDGKASLTEFGLSALVPERRSQTLVPTICGGTAPYMAPECLAVDDEDYESTPVFSPKSDVYSFGGSMLQARNLNYQYLNQLKSLQVLEGKVPYYYIHLNTLTILTFILRGKRPKRPLVSVVGDSDWNFTQTCWLKDERRPSDEDILKFVEGRAGIQS